MNVMRAIVALLAASTVLLGGATPAAAQSRKKVIVDQDARGPASTDMQSILLFLQAPLAQYHTQFARSSYMWDEISAIAWMDPSIITKQQELFVNIDIDHGPSYGQTIFVEREMEGGPGRPAVARKMPSWWQMAAVQWDLDTARFYKMYVDLMSRPPRSGSSASDRNEQARASGTPAAR